MRAQARTAISYTYKVKLNAHTHRNLAKFLKQQRLLYNGALQERIDCYQKTGESISLFNERGSVTRSAIPMTGLTSWTGGVGIRRWLGSTGHSNGYSGKVAAFRGASAGGQLVRINPSR